MKISVITPFFHGNEYMPAFFDCMAKNGASLSRSRREACSCGGESDSHIADKTSSLLEIILVNDSPDIEIALPDECLPITDTCKNLCESGGDSHENAQDENDKSAGNDHNGEKINHESIKIAKTIKKIKEYNFRGMEIKVVTLFKNSGIHHARAAGLWISAGDFVIFLDQDDIIAPDALSKLAASDIFKPNIELVISNALLEQKSGCEAWYRTKYHKNKIWNLKTYLTVGTQIISPGQVLIRKSAIPDTWSEHILTHNCCDDYYLWLLLLGAGKKAAYVDETLYLHSFTGVNASLNMKETFESTLEMIDAVRLSDVLTNHQINTLERMTKFKAAFRGDILGQSPVSGASGLCVRLALAARHPYLFFSNIIFKLKTKTPYGFNR